MNKRRRKHERLMSLPFERIPKKHRWIKDSEPGTPEFQLKHGIHLRHFGFEFEGLADDEPTVTTVFPPEFPAYLFCNTHKFSSKRVFGLVKPDASFVFCQNYVDRTRVLELLEEPSVQPVSLVKFGRYLWCKDGAHRIVAAVLEGRRVFAVTRTYIEV